MARRSLLAKPPKGPSRSAIAAERRREHNAHIGRVLNRKAQDADAERHWLDELREGRPGASDYYVSIGERETEWDARPWERGPSKRELSAALAPRLRPRRRPIPGGGWVKVRAYRRRRPGGGS